MSILIDTTKIKVAKQGVDAATADEDELMLSIGQRTGQILGRGQFSMSGANGGANGSGSIGPFDRAPGLVGYAGNTDGFVHIPPVMVNDIRAQAGPPQLAETFVCQSMSLDSNSVAASGFYRDTLGAPAPNRFCYLIFRKPNRS